MKRCYRLLLTLPLCASLLSCGKQTNITDSTPAPSGIASQASNAAFLSSDLTAAPSGTALSSSDTPSGADLPSPATPSSATFPSPDTETASPITPTLAAGASTTPSPTPTIKAMPTNTPTPKPTMLVPTPTPILPLDPEISYISIPVPGAEVTLYISKDPAQPQVVVHKEGGNFHFFDWDYNLEYGYPIVYIPKEPTTLRGLGFSGDVETDEGEILAIWLPTESAEEPAFPFYEPNNGKQEICGECHCLSLEALSTAAPNTLQDTLIDASTNAKLFGTLDTGYLKNQDTALWQEKEVFSVFSGDGSVLVQYPMFCLPAGQECPIVYGKIHATKDGTIYQKFGINIAEEIFWLGQFINGKIYFWDEYIFELDERHTPSLYSWAPRKFADEGEDAWLDLDGDGIPEQICWYTEDTGNSQHLKMSINGTEYEIPDPEWDLYSPVFTLSLDGKTNLLAVADYAYAALCGFEVFGYRNGEIYEVGEFSLSYRKVEEGENNVYISSHYSYPLQHDYFWAVKKFENGTLQNIPQDYYEFVREPNSASRHTLSVKRSIDLYREKGGDDTFLLPEGSCAMTLGTDFENWILVENLDTGEQGWLHVPMEEYRGRICILPDGTELEGEEIFDGLDNWVSG